MHKPATAVLFILLFLSLPAGAQKVQDVDIPDTLSVPADATELVLNGAGIREKFFLDIYIGALYLPVATTDASAILNDTGAASVLMHFLHSEVSREKIIAGWQDGLAANLGNAELAALQPRLDRFNKLFTPVGTGDVIRIDYTPARGTEVRINNEWRGAIEGNDFFRALLQVWLGPSPVSKPLRQGMLGLD